MTERSDERKLGHIETLLYWEMGKVQKYPGQTKRTDRMPKEYIEVCEKFLTYLRAKQHKIGTQLIRLYTLRRLWDFCYYNKNKHNFNDITREDVNEYMGSLTNSVAQYNIQVGCLNVFFRWLYDVPKPNKPEQTRDLSYLKEKQREDPQLLNPEEVLEMAKRAHSQMHRAFILLLYETGGRIGEILNMNVEDVILEKGRMKVRLKGKTGERKIAILDAAPDVTLWLEQHPLADKPTAPLFFGKQGKRMVENSAGEYIKDLGKKVLGRRVYPHLFRHSTATRLSKVMTEQMIKKRMGWVGDSSMVAHYSHPTEQDVDDAYLTSRGETIEKPSTENKLKPKICPGCKKENSVLLSYCHYCGRPLDEERVKEVEKERVFQKAMMERLLLSEQLIREKITKEDYERRLKELEEKTGIMLV
jgi:integrase